MWQEGRIREMASSHHGLVTREALISVGVTRAEIGWRLASGRLEERHPGVYYLDATPGTWKTDLLAAVWAAGSHAAASHRSAALVWALDGVRSRLLEVTVPFTKGPEPDGTILHRTRRPVDTTIKDGIPTTSLERTLLDLAALMPTPVMEKAVGSAVRSNETTLDAIDDQIGRAGGRGVTGTRKLRTVLRLVEGDKSGSAAEVDAIRLIREAPIPSPIQQLQIRLPDGSNAYPDLSWPDRKRIVEVDGFEAHSTPDQLSHDLARQNALMSLGWQIRRFPARELRRDPAGVIGEIVKFVNSDRSVRVGTA